MLGASLVGVGEEGFAEMVEGAGYLSHEEGIILEGFKGGGLKLNIILEK